MKKTLFVFLSIILCIFLVGCGNKENESSLSTSASLTEIMDSLYEGIPEDELPMALQNAE